MDGGGWNITGEDSFLTHLQKVCPQIKETWDDVHHLMSVLKALRNKISSLDHALNTVNDMVVWVRSVKRWDKFEVMSALKAVAWNDIQPLPQPRWAEPTIIDIYQLSSSMDSWPARMPC